MANVIAGKTFVSGETVTPAKLNSLGLPTVALVDDEVTTSKLLNAAVTADKLATGAVTGAAGGGKLAASAITDQTTIADPLADTDTFLVHDASASALRKVAWSSMRSSGAPIQIVQAVKTDTQTITNTTTSWVDVTGLSLTLTRAIASASGKVRVQAVVSTSQSSGFPMAVRVVRGSTEIGIGDAAGNRVRATAQAGNSDSYGIFPIAVDFIDSSPGSSSTVTYKIQINFNTNPNGTCTVMLPWQKAKAWWDENISTETFEETLGWHLTNGLVYSTPQVFLLARETHWDGKEANDEAGEHNSWFVELAAGTGGADLFRKLMSVAPRPHEWLLWHRHGSFERLRAYQWEKLQKKVRTK